MAFSTHVSYCRVGRRDIHRLTNAAYPEPWSKGQTDRGSFVRLPPCCAFSAAGIPDAEGLNMKLLLILALLLTLDACQNPSRVQTEQNATP